MIRIRIGVGAYYILIYAHDVGTTVTRRIINIVITRMDNNDDDACPEKYGNGSSADLRRSYTIRWHTTRVPDLFRILFLTRFEIYIKNRSTENVLSVQRYYYNITC